MFDVLRCIRDQHNEWLVLLAAVICVISTITSVQLLRHARHLRGLSATRWICTAGTAIGFGIWATHFVAMLGYDTGVIAGFRIPATAFSLVTAIAMTTMSFSTALFWQDRQGFALASVLGGGGVAAMHYIGMSAMELPATIIWNPAYVVVSVLLAIALAYPALVLAVRGRSVRSGVAAGLAMTLSIVLLHFTGMAAVRLVPAPLPTRTGVLLSPEMMATSIATTALFLLAICIAILTVSRKARLVLHASERDMAIIVKGITDCAIYMLDRGGRVANWNAGAQRLKGYIDSEAIGMPLAEFYTQEDRADHMPQRALAEAAENGKFSGEGWRVRRDGSRFWAHVTIEKVAEEDGRHIGFAKITRDMTRYKEDEDRLKALAGHLDAALGNMHQGLCLFGPDERLRVVNTRFKEIWGLDRDVNLVGLTISEVSRKVLEVHAKADVPQGRIGELQGLLAVAPADAGGSPVILELGDDLVVSMMGRSMPEGGWVTTFEDVTERRRSDARIAHMAMHDGLTGLPNRTSFTHWIDAEIAQAEHFGHELATVIIDLDRFKEINDTRGHAAGDSALQHLSRRLLDVLAEGEIVARLGGDEFAAAKRYKDKAELAHFVDRLEACFSTPFGAGENGFHLDASIGLAVFPQDARQREQLLNNADLAMYRAKASVGERIAYYEPAMDETARARRQIANDLRQAIDRDELTVLYQPQHCLATGELSGYEALLRWHHPTRGLVRPDEFIVVAEETGEIFRIGEWVLREACREARSWAPELKVAVNLSAVQLGQTDIVEVVHGILVDTGLSPSRLELEITETAIIADKLRALHLLRRIKGLGVSIAIDDFGTGYSSLDTLHSFPFDKIKIDKSFLMKSDNAQARAIIKAVLALGQSLQVPVLAEGVETASQLDLLKEQGCDEAQGYYFGRPGLSPSLLARQADRQSA